MIPAYRKRPVSPRTHNERSIRGDECFFNVQMDVSCVLQESEFHRFPVTTCNGDMCDTLQRTDVPLSAIDDDDPAESGAQGNRANMLECQQIVPLQIR